MHSTFPPSFTTPEFILIGIGGLSCSGKSTISQKLKNHYNEQLHILHEDDYYHDKSKMPILNHRGVLIEDWDCLEALNHERLLEDINQLMRNNQKEKTIQIILIEGFLTLTDHRLTNLLSLKILLTLSLEKLLIRRKNRVYPLPNDGFFTDPEGYIEEVVYPRFLEYYEPVLKEGSDGVNLMLDTSDLGLEECFERVLKVIKDKIGF